MKMIFVRIIVCSVALLLALGCGVKGRPQAPYTPALLGRGEPSFSKATEKVRIRKKPMQKIEGDFEDSDDFEVIEVEK